MVLKFMLATMAAAAIRTHRQEARAPRPPVAAAPDDMEMEPAPIDPAWILSGSPVARVSLHSRAYDRLARTAVWDCTAGTFRWYFGWDETVVILDGEVHVTGEDGSERTLKAGDVAYFPARSWATWHIDSYVRKVAFCRKELPIPIDMALKLRDRVRAIRRSSGGLAA